MECIIIYNGCGDDEDDVDYNADHNGFVFDCSTSDNDNDDGSGNDDYIQWSLHLSPRKFIKIAVCVTMLL